MKQKHIFLFVLFCLIGAGVLFFQKSAKSNSLEKNEGRKLRVSTSFYPLYYFTTQIAGDHAEVRNITPAGAEPHDYEPTTSDIAWIERSDLLILNGELESWGSKIADNLPAGKVITAGINSFALQVREGDISSVDPHIWLDPTLALKEVDVITRAFISIDPGNTESYLNNQEQLNEKLTLLDQEFKNGLSNCKRRDFVTSHAAFSYLASRYNLNQVAISGLSPEEEPSAQQLASVAQFAKQNNVAYIFFESLVSPKLAQTVASEIGAQTLVLDPIEGVSADDLHAGKDYHSIMQSNLKNLQIALECNK